MSAKELHDVFAVLAIIALAGAVLMVLAKLIPTVASVRGLALLHRVQLPLAALVATTATLGSLWFSERGNHWTPCRFCWFQRIFMYSSAVVLLIGAIRRDRGVKWYAVPLAGIGIIISGWHILIEHGVIGESKVCTTPCAVPYYISFGDQRNDLLGPAHWYGITLAVMAFSGFAAILALLLTPEPLEPTEEHDGEPSTS